VLPKLTHPWDLPPEEAVQLQNELRGLVVTEDAFSRVSAVAGVDVSVRNNTTTAGIVVLSFPDLEPVENVVEQGKITFPYVPGLLTFREGPVILAAFEKLQAIPDIAMFDGQGIAHPRRFGIACHIGVLLDLPSIGVGKTRLTGHYTEPKDKPGSTSPLTDHGEVIGSVVRTKAGVTPVFISTGHKVSLNSAVNLTLQSTTRYRLPEPTRQAHMLAGLSGIK
jgi:deoxyribonuclease V